MRKYRISLFSCDACARERSVCVILAFQEFKMTSCCNSRLAMVAQVLAFGDLIRQDRHSKDQCASSEKLMANVVECKFTKRFKRDDFLGVWGTPLTLLERCRIVACKIS